MNAEWSVTRWLWSSTAAVNRKAQMVRNGKDRPRRTPNLQPRLPLLFQRCVNIFETSDQRVNSSPSLCLPVGKMAAIQLVNVLTETVIVLMILGLKFVAKSKPQMELVTCPPIHRLKLNAVKCDRLNPATICSADWAVTMDSNTTLKAVPSARAETPARTLGALKTKFANWLNQTRPAVTAGVRPCPSVSLGSGYNNDYNNTNSDDHNYNTFKNNTQNNYNE